jgi:flagellin-like hook-associated protein FlgL
MLSINVNPAASGAGLNLGKANEALQKSLARLSSGRRIVKSSDDAGGLAVSMKMAAAQKRTEATAINLRNTVSILDTQDGAFTIADKVLSRMSELTTLARDVSKNSGDIENYDKEFQNLQKQLISLGSSKFNGVPLFMDGGNPSSFENTSSTGGTTFSVPISEDGSQSSSVTQASLVQDPWLNMMINGFAKVSWSSNQDLYIPRYPIPSELGYTLSGQTISLSPVQIGGAAIALGFPSPLNRDTSGVAQITTSSYTLRIESTGNPRLGSNGYNILTTIGTNSTGLTWVDHNSANPLIDNSASNGSWDELWRTPPKGMLTYSNSDEFAQVAQMALQQVADMRAQNGAEMSRINFAQDLLNINAVNLEAANSRIMDVDVAAESSQLARFQILQQAGTAMLAQANTSQQNLVRLLQG